jgi:hypothetical protein
MSVPSDASRRELLKVVGVGAAGAAILTLPARKLVAERPAPVSPEVVPAAPPETKPVEPPHFVNDLAGTQLGPYHVDSVGALERGGVPIVLCAPSGARFRVDVLRVDPADGAAGIGFVGSVSVYLRNGGDGNTATDEEQGLGAMALAEELVRREREGRRPPPDLLTRGEREALDAARFA